MKPNILLLILLLTLIFNACNCTKEYDCDDYPIQPAFIGFTLAEIDTLVFRRFKEKDNFRTLIDTVIVTKNNQYQTSNDTTKIVHYELDKGIKVGFDWQLFIPAINKTVMITDIISNKKEGKCGFRAVGEACSCTNDLFSAKQDNQVITFRDIFFERPFFYIRR